ncbi:unnamed protein product [Ectocarpus sp. CCAP 1310/34]|nr:unnamed protein product [Ectocarpus sp. CCAP 1310/34]
MCDGKRWYTSTKELQQASLEFCIACRKYQTLRLRVDVQTPRTLLAAVDAPSPHSKRPCRTRVPRLRARRVIWNMPTATELKSPIFALKDVVRLDFGPAFEGSLESVAWPQRLKEIDFSWGSLFNQPIEGVEFPPSLLELRLSDAFDQPIEDAILPKSLQFFMFGDDFNHPVDDIRWPPSLEQVFFGKHFNQPIEEVVWPSSLKELTFGYRSRFDQPIKDVEWPASLRQLTFGEAFDQPIESVTFPASLEELAFDTDFNQPIEGVTWPDSLQRLAFGFLFNQPIDNVRWPASLEEVCFGKHESQGFDHAIMFSEFNQRVDMCAWPASMRRLTLGHKFRQSLQGLGTWIPNLEIFHFLDHSNGSGDEDSLLRGIEWPTGLRQLAVFRDSRLDGVIIPSTVEVSRLCNESPTW